MQATETGRDPPSPIALMYWSQAAAIQQHLNLHLEAGTVCGVMVAGLAAPSMLHEFASLRWKAAAISVCSMNRNL